MPKVTEIFTNLHKKFCEYPYVYLVCFGAQLLFYEQNNANFVGRIYAQHCTLYDVCQ